MVKISVFLRRLGRPFNQLLITAALALPKRVYRVWISGVLINRAIRWDDLSTTYRAGASASGSLLDIYVCQLALVVHFSPDWFLSSHSAGLAMAKAKNKDIAEHRQWRHKPQQRANTQWLGKNPASTNAQTQ